MHEVEVKILDINPAEVRKKLKKAGARKVFENTTIHARCYDFPDSRIRKAGDHVRLRKVGKEAEITFKDLKSRKKYKDNVETDVPVGDFGAMHRFFRKLGLKMYADYKKKRSRYRLGKWQYDIDKYPKIPTFVEIEVKSESAVKARKEVEKAVKLLGYTMKDTNPWNGFEVHRHYNVKLR